MGTDNRHLKQKSFAFFGGFPINVYLCLRYETDDICCQQLAE